MRIHFQDKPYDLLAVAVLAAALLGTLAIGGIPRIILGLVLVLILPGYVVVAALFPSNRELDWVERGALSVGLSVAVVPLVGLLLNFTPWGIRFVLILTSLLVFTAAVSIAAYARRRRLPVEDRLSLTLEIGRPNWAEYTALDKALTFGLAGAVVTAGGILAYVATTPRPGEHFTEFYLLNVEGRAENYPTNLTAPANATIVVGVVNHEGKSFNYSVVADLEKYNVTTNATGAQVKSLVSSQPVANFPMTLLDSGKSERNLAFSVAQPGLFRLSLQLFLEGSGTPYRELHLWITVR